MSTSPFSSYDFLHEYLFSVNFDYDQCMKQSFYKDLKKAFKKVKEKYDADCDAELIDFGYQYDFIDYLHAAHKACALLTMYVDKRPLRTYEQMYEVVYHYLCIGDYKENVCIPQADRFLILFPREMILVLHLMYAILSAKGETVPHELIDLAENHLANEKLIHEASERITTIYKNMMRETLGEYCKNDVNDILYPYTNKKVLEDWTEVREQLYMPIKRIAEKYQGQPIYSSIKLRAKSWQSSEWPQADLTQWICQQTKRTTKYDVRLAKHFIRFWDNAEERLIVVDAIDNWSQQHPESFKDRAQEIASLRTYASSLPDSELEEVTIPTGQGPIRIKLRKPNENKKKGISLVDFVRIFHVMYKLGMFTHESKEKLDEQDLFNALATFFDCPQLTDWSNKMSSAKAQSNNHLTIFDTLKEKMEKVLDK